VGGDVERAGDLIHLLYRLVLFGLGVAVILDAVISPGASIGELLSGLILLGLVPVADLLDRIGPRRDKP
jgi:hypothetical protein